MSAVIMGVVHFTEKSFHRNSFRRKIIAENSFHRKFISSKNSFHRKIISSKIISPKIISSKKVAENSFHRTFISSKKHFAGKLLLDNNLFLNTADLRLFF